jgi:ferredoxin
MAKMGYLRDVVSLEIDPDKCNGCGICLKVCPHEVLSRHGKIVQVLDRDACMECGACAKNCEPEAIRVRAGVGCAAAVLNVVLGRTDAPCCGSSAGSKSCC